MSAFGFEGQVLVFCQFFAFCIPFLGQYILSLGRSSFTLLLIVVEFHHRICRNLHERVHRRGNRVYQPEVSGVVAQCPQSLECRHLPGGIPDVLCQGKCLEICFFFLRVSVEVFVYICDGMKHCNLFRNPAQVVEAFRCVLIRRQCFLILAG